MTRYYAVYVVAFVRSFSLKGRVLKRNQPTQTIDDAGGIFDSKHRS